MAGNLLVVDWDAFFPNPRECEDKTVYSAWSIPSSTGATASVSAPRWPPPSGPTAPPGS